jgi:type IV secretion system protein VirD4
VYSTAVLALKPWLEPSVAHSASVNPHLDYTGTATWLRVPRYVDLDWLMSGEGSHANTLYLAAPSAEFERLSPVLGGLLADLKDTIHAWDIAGRRLGKPLLIVIDEAAQLQLGWLPTEVSTIAALDAFFVTCWQNLAQINHRYGTLADAVLSGHRTKCFFAGIDDPATGKYLTGLLGHERITRQSRSQDVPTLLDGRQSGRRSVSESTQREELAPAHTIREMVPGQAVLLHGTLPPIHLDAIRWWTEPGLAAMIPADAAGKPLPPDAGTCPLTDQKVAKETAGPVDVSTIESTRRQLPKPEKRPAVESESPVQDGRAVDQRRSNGDSDRRGHDASSNRPVKGRCFYCRTDLGEGEGRLDRQGNKTIVRCSPNCTERRRQRRGSVT